MSDPKEIQRLRALQDANAVAIQRMKNQMQAQGARPRQQQVEVDDDDEQFVPPENLPQNQRQQGPQYQQVDPNGQLVQHIIQQAGQHAANQVANQTVGQSAIKARMEGLMEKYPAMRQDDHPLTIRARDEFARIQKINPNLDQATAYELAAADAASFLGIRPHNQSIEEYMKYDYTMGSNSSLSAAPKKTRGSRLTKPILQFADAVNINVDARTPEGKKNLEELAEYTERFKADRDESEFKYK